MKRINLTSFGFVRDEASDFSDDGSRFYVYRVGKVKVSKSIWNERVYLSGHADIDGNLAYAEYSKLAHYKDLDALNGVSISGLTESDLQKLYEDCRTYELEYMQATVQKRLSLPTLSEVAQRLSEAVKVRQTEINTLSQRLAQFGNALDVMLSAPSRYWLSSFADYVKNLDEIQNNRYSIKRYVEDDGTVKFCAAEIMRPDWNELQPSYYYLSASKLIDDYKKGN
jgi:hypothetical protein